MPSSLLTKYKTKKGGNFLITQNLPTLKIHKLTQAQYDRELAAGNIDENALYLTPDEEIDLSGYATIDSVLTRVLTSEDYGTELPPAGTAGRIFFKKA